LPEIIDNKGNDFVRVLEIDVDTTKLTHVVSDDQLYLFKVNPENKEVVLKVELFGLKSSGGFIYNNELLVPGKKLSFDFGIYTFEGAIISIDEETESNN